MTFFAKTKYKNKRTFALISVIAFVLFVLCCLISPVSGIAEAVLPAGYVTQVAEKDLDWQTGENYLDLARLKSIVSSWFINPDLDFEGISPVIVAVIDSGLNVNHELFSGKYDNEGNPTSSDGVGEYDVLLRDSDGTVIGANTVSQDNKDYSSVDFSFDDDAPDRHGTHVAGIIATLIHELNLERFIKILPVKAAYPNGSGSSSQPDALTKAVNFALSQNADVVNMSLSSTSSTYGGNITETEAKKAVFVAAAGNESKNTVSYPASNNNVIGVMNYTKTLSGKIEIASTSNYGSTFDICAPGSAIYSANGASTTGYKSLSGTSMASPVVAFAAALVTLKSRAIANASGASIGADEIAAKVKEGYTSTVLKGGREYKVLDICKLAQGYDITFAKIEIVDGSLVQKVGEVSPIRMKLEVYPYLVENVGNVDWYIDGVLVHSGFEFVYTPKNECYEVVLNAVWYVENESGIIEKNAFCTVSVEYYVLDAPMIKTLEISLTDESGNSQIKDNYRIGEKLLLSFGNFPMQSISSDTSILWVINGEVVGTGSEFLFVPSEKGKYTISAKINGIYTTAVVIEVNSISKDLSDLLKILTIVLFSLIATAAAITLLIIVLRRKRR